MPLEMIKSDNKILMIHIIDQVIVLVTLINLIISAECYYYLFNENNLYAYFARKIYQLYDFHNSQINFNFFLQ